MFLKIGNVEIKGKVVLAPMAGVCNMPFRQICHDYGAALVCAEMVNTTAIVHNNQKTQNMLSISPNEHPMSLQIFGNNPEHFGEVAKYVEENVACDIIDINMGCPMRKIAIKVNAGSALTRDLEKVRDIIIAVKKNTTKPVTIKYRLGWDENAINCVDVAKVAEAAGAAAVTLHTRTRSQMFKGSAKEAWKFIKQVKDAVKIPVIGNGDVTTPEDVQEMLETTGCDLVMIARGAQGNPWIFEQTNYYLETGKKLSKPDFEEWKQTIIKHTQGLIEQWGEKVAFAQMRGHGNDYLSKTRISDIAPLKARMSLVSSFDKMIEILDEIQDKYNKEVF